LKIKDRDNKIGTDRGENGLPVGKEVEEAVSEKGGGRAEALRGGREPLLRLSKKQLSRGRWSREEERGYKKPGQSNSYKGGGRGGKVRKGGKEKTHCSWQKKAES